MLDGLDLNLISGRDSTNHLHCDAPPLSLIKANVLKHNAHSRHEYHLSTTQKHMNKLSS